MLLSLSNNTKEKNNKKKRPQNLQIQSDLPLPKHNYKHLTSREWKVLLYI